MSPSRDAPAGSCPDRARRSAPNRASCSPRKRALPSRRIASTLLHDFQPPPSAFARDTTALSRASRATSCLSCAAISVRCASSTAKMSRIPAEANLRAIECGLALHDGVPQRQLLRIDRMNRARALSRRRRGRIARRPDRLPAARPRAPEPHCARLCAAAIKDRLHEGGGECDRASGAGERCNGGVESGVLYRAGRGERDARKERGTRDEQIGMRRAELILRRRDIGPMHESSAGVEGASVGVEMSSRLWPRRRIVRAVPRAARGRRGLVFLLLELTRSDSAVATSARCAATSCGPVAPAEKRALKASSIRCAAFTSDLRMRSALAVRQPGNTFRQRMHQSRARAHRDRRGARGLSAPRSRGRDGSHPRSRARSWRRVLPKNPFQRRVDRDLTPKVRGVGIQ